jgi:hypothetical protein
MTMTPLALSGLLTAITGFSLIAFIASVGQRNVLNRLMMLFNICVGSWGLGTMWAGLAQTPMQGVWAWRFAHSTAIFLAPIFYHLALTLRGLDQKKSLRIAYLLTLGFSLSYLGPGINQSQWLFDSLHYNKATPLFLLSFVMWLILVFLGHYHLFHVYRREKGQKRRQLRIVFYAFATGFAGGTTVLLPMFGLSWYPYGNFTIPIYILLITYAILRYQFLDIRLAIRSGLVSGLVVASLTTR